MISLPALLRWFTSRSLAPPQYLLPARGVCLTAYGLPHSAICGSKDVCSSPQLFAAYRGLLRRTAPRHPPQTYSCLTIFSFPRFKLPTAYALKPSSLPYIFKEHAYPAGTPSLLSFLNLGQNRVELLTPALSERCSNQLSYCPVFDNSRTCLLIKGHRERKKAGLSQNTLVRTTSFDTCGLRAYTARPSSLGKGGDPAAPSGTTTLLRLHPPHKAYLRQRPPCGWTAGFGYPLLGWCDGRCVQGPGTYSPRRADVRLLAIPAS